MKTGSGRIRANQENKFSVLWLSGALRKCVLIDPSRFHLWSNTLMKRNRITLSANFFCLFFVFCFFPVMPLEQERLLSELISSEATLNPNCQEHNTIWRKFTYGTFYYATPLGSGQLFKEKTDAQLKGGVKQQSQFYFVKHLLVYIAQFKDRNL